MSSQFVGDEANDTNQGDYDIIICLAEMRVVVNLDSWGLG